VKYVLLSADNAPSVYLVPDVVADNLREYCIAFCDHWLHESPDAKEYQLGDGVGYNEEDFIKYLNKWIFPETPSLLIETLGWTASKSDVPALYKNCEWFNF